MQLQDNWVAKAIVIAIAILVVGIIRAEAMGTLGGKHAVQGSENSMEIEELGRFAIQHHNLQQNENGLLSFSRVVKVEQQVVAGTMYHLTLEAKQDGDSSPKLYEAKVWVKPWENFKKLEEFKPSSSSSSPSITSADLGVKHEGLGAGWREVPVHDPVIQEAAEQAVTNIQQRSNSLAAYMLQEVLSSKAEVIDGFAKFDLLLKTKRGVKEEQHKVEMHRNLDGVWMLNSHSTDVGN